MTLKLKVKKILLLTLKLTIGFLQTSTFGQETFKYRRSEGILEYRYPREIDQYDTDIPYSIYNFSGEKLLDFGRTRMCIQIEFLPNSDTGFIFIQPCSYSRAPDAHAGKYGYINKQGKIIIPPVFDARQIRFMSEDGNLSACLFNTGRALVASEINMFYYINSTGEKVLPSDSSYYHIAEPYTKYGYAKVTAKRGEFPILIDTSGNQLYKSIKYNHIGNFYNNWAYPFPSGYAFMTRGSKEKEFFILNPDTVEVFSHPHKDTEYMYDFSYGIDRTFRIGSSLGHGLFVMYREKLKKEYHKEGNFDEARLISFDGKILSDWKKIPAGHRLNFNGNQFIDTHSELSFIGFDVEIHPSPQTTDLRWNNVVEKQEYFKYFKLSFDENYLLNMFQKTFLLKQ